MLEAVKGNTKRNRIRNTNIRLELQIYGYTKEIGKMTGEDEVKHDENEQLKFTDLNQLEE